ncbi:MAG: DUF2628 domain-containing protein [Alphaproteobacteria bacterium]|nr:DUF2628 domain-containing protein [Alphaproteobacteria bacterium SS10]
MAIDPQDDAKSDQKATLPGFQREAVGQSDDGGDSNAGAPADRGGLGRDGSGGVLVDDLPDDPPVGDFDPLAELDDPKPEARTHPATNQTGNAGASNTYKELAFKDYVFSDRMADWLLVYVGPNPKPYAGTYKRMVRRRSTMLISWSFPAFFFTLAWFIYRRMWLLALVLMGGPFLLVNISPVIFANTFGAVPFIGALLGKSMYLNRAFRQIYAIEQMSIGDEQKRELIKEAGGISVIGGVLGAFAMITAYGMVLVMLAALLGVAAQLPTY